MRWIDVAGAPGVGKSAILDDLWPRKIALDGKGPCREWNEFCDCAARLASRAFRPDECRGLIDATICKIATIARRQDPGIYVQAGLAQIGLELGWRLSDADALREIYGLMPVSGGVVFMIADVETVQARNRSRTRNFAERVPAMVRAIEIGRQVIQARGVPVLCIDTRQPINVSRATLRAFIAPLT